MPFYDRMELIVAALRTVYKALLEGIVLVDCRVVPVPGQRTERPDRDGDAHRRPVGHVHRHGSGGLHGQSDVFGGLVIAIGMMVDGSVVVVENIYRHLERTSPSASVRRGSIVLKAAKEVAQPVLFGILIIILVFLPILSLQGMEGKMFKPLAYTIMIALLVSLLLSLTLSPVLCVRLALNRAAEGYPCCCDGPSAVSAHPCTGRWRIARVCCPRRWQCWSAVLRSFPFLGGEFIPILNEARDTPQTIRLPSISLEKSIEIEKEVQRAVMEFPEVRMVVSKIGRSELGNDPQEPNASDPVVSLKPMEEWTTAKTKPELDDAIRRRIERVPGANFLMSQPIQQRVDELLSGVRSEATVKVIGDDLDTLRRMAEQIQAIMTGIAGRQGCARGTTLRPGLPDDRYRSGEDRAAWHQRRARAEKSSRRRSAPKRPPGSMRDSNGST